MNKFLVILAISALVAGETERVSFSSLEQSIEELIDESGLCLLNPEFLERKTAKIRLSNGLQAYLISDPKADQSAAAVAVGVGSWSDPLEYPGMAHFCEHMLFGGSKTYPQEEEFDRMVSDYSGVSNAFTAPDRTVYFFSANHSGFKPLLDRFSRFFSEPLLSPSLIARELYAVDQEFGKNLENDAWRLLMVLKETGNTEHPQAKFSTGNADTLRGIPQKALREWLQTHYVAEKMRVVLYSVVPLEELKKLCIELFSGISTKESPEISWDVLTSHRQRGHLILINPIADRQRLTLMWELPREICLDPGKPAELLAYALERGQSYSLHEQLKKEGLIHETQISVSSMSGIDHLFFQIGLDLTEEGLEHRDLVILRCFQALARFKYEMMPEFLLEEANQVALLGYQYQERKHAFHTVASLGESILDEPLDSYPRKQLLISEYRPEQIKHVVRLLTPEKCIYLLQADPSKMGLSTDHQERWMGVEYAIQDLSQHSLEQWKNADPLSTLRIPEPNPYLSKEIKVFPGEKNSPIRIEQGPRGEVYYSRCAEFLTPEGVYSLRIKTPQMNAKAEENCLLHLFCEALSEQLHADLAAAEAAGIRSTISPGPYSLELKVYGFSDKAPLLLKKELQRILHPNPVTKEQFARYRDYLLRVYANHNKEMALSQAGERVAALLNPDQRTSKELFSALKEITFEQFLDFQRTLFDAVYFEAFFTGNLTQAEAAQCWSEIKASCEKKEVFPKAHHAQKKILSLPADRGPFVIRETSQALGNAVVLVLDEGVFTPERRAVQEILSSALSSAFYDTLRTKQKTGYIVQSSCSESELRLFHTFQVQSNSHHPEELLHRFELFLETQLQNLEEEIPEERFSLLKQNRKELLQNSIRNLGDLSALLYQFAFDREGDFEWLQKRLQGYEELTYETFLSEAKAILSRMNRKRIAVLVEGRTESPFVYQSITSPEIEETCGYLTRSELRS